MKLQKFSFKKIVPSLKGSMSLEKKNLYYPRRDWMIIILLFGLTLIVSVVVHYGLYVLTEKGQMFNKSAEQELFQTALKRDTIDDVVEEYTLKVLNTNSFDQNKEILTDPS